MRDSTLPRTAKLVAHTIATYMNAAGDATLLRQTIARGASISDRAVDAALKQLETAGYLRVERAKPHGRGRSSHYLAPLPGNANALRLSATERRTARHKKANALRPEVEVK